LDNHWQVESQRLVNQYFPARSDVVLNQFRSLGLYPPVAAPQFSQFGGQLPDDFRLTMTAAQGEIYFTTDGSDPAADDGGFGENARRYRGAVPLAQTALVRARARFNGLWSAVTEAVFLKPLPLQLTELHVSASRNSDNGEDGDLLDFLELMNAGDQPIDMRGIQFVRGIAFSFDNSDVQQLLPGERTVIVSNVEAFTRRYGTDGIRIAGQYTGRLSNSDRLIVKGSLDQTLLNVAWDKDWYEIVADEHFSLVLRDETHLVRDLGDPNLWRPSHFVDGSPGSADPGLNPDDIVISEALTHSDGQVGDWLELHNTTDRSIDLSGWYLSGRSSDLRLYQIPDSTIIPADGYLFFSDSEASGPEVRQGGTTGFQISKLGERIFLTSKGRNDSELGGYRFVVDFTYGFNSSSFIRHTNSSGQTEYVLALQKTPGFANVSPPAVERLRDHNAPYREAVISEVMFYPQGAGDEFIELYNPHSSQVSLELPFGPSWRFTDGVSFNFPDSPAPLLAPMSYALIVGIDPTVFRQKYNVPAETPIFGPYLGELLNDGERLVVSRAAEPAAFVPFSMSDAVHYNHPSGNWPAEANGQGASLIRNSFRAYGNDVTNWQAGNFGGTPGRPNRTWDGDAQVVDRMVFYNQSRFDHDSAAIDAADDSAIAVDKFALRPGQRATFLNYTSYVRGLNGIMIDIRNLAGNPSLADLELRVGTSEDPANWSLAPTPAEFQLRRGAGYDHSDRLVLTFADGAIVGQWLQVRVKATQTTGLPQDDVFYFGNAIGDTGDDPRNTFVDGTDYVRIRNDLRQTRLVEETDLFDIDRDGTVSQLDLQVIARHATNAQTALPLIAAPGQKGVVSHIDAAPSKSLPTPLPTAAIDHLAGASFLLGDMNGDDVFDHRDLNLMAAALAYEASVTVAGPSQGDWNGDGVFDSQDIVFVFQHGRFG
jgi:hypothetical protein